VKTGLSEDTKVSCLAELTSPTTFYGMYCIYVLQSKKDKSLYIGFTQDVKKRLIEHNKGLCSSTRNKRPLRLAFYEAYTSEVDARTRESRLKQLLRNLKSGGGFNSLIRFMFTIVP